MIDAIIMATTAHFNDIKEKTIIPKDNPILILYPQRVKEINRAKTMRW